MKVFFDRLFRGTREDFFAELDAALDANEKTFVVTANPEAFMIGEKDPLMGELLCSEATTVVADGIGIVKGAAMLGINLSERIPGVDIAQHLMEQGSKQRKSIFLLGSRQEVLDAMVKVMAEKYHGLTLAGAINGYVPDKDAAFEEIKKAEPDIVLVALGIPAQEKLIYKHLTGFKKGIFVGVGGSLDVLSGTKARAPRLFIRCNLEWLYRLIKEPSRIKRFCNNNIKFIFKLRKMK